MILKPDGRNFLFGIKTRILCPPSHSHAFRSLRFLARRAARCFPSRVLKKDPSQIVGEKARNKFARKPANCVSLAAVFLFFFNLPREGDAYAAHIATCVHTWTFMRPVAVTVSSSLARGREKKKELFEERTREERREGMRAGVGETETGSTKRARERESACRSEALYSSVERDLGAQCYDGHQADRSQPLSASCGPHVVPPVRPADRTSRLIASN